MAGARAILKRFDITVASGWVKLSNTPTGPANVRLFASGNQQINLRQNGGPEVLLRSEIYRLRGVDLSTLEIQTASVLSQAVNVIGTFR